MTKNFRGQELYIYPPDTFLKPILVLSKTRGEFAIQFCGGLNHFTLLECGLKGEWIVIQKGQNDKFDKWKNKLQSEEDWDFYLDVYKKFVTDRERKRMVTI